jgi:hypothetical protein
MIIKIYRRPAASAIAYLGGPWPKTPPVLVDGDLKRDAKATSQPPLAITSPWEGPLVESPEQLRRVALELTRMMHEEIGSEQIARYLVVHHDKPEKKREGGGL